MAQGAERHFGAAQYDANMANLVLLFQRPRVNGYDSTFGEMKLVT
jgi:hypothetical protein